MFFIMPKHTYRKPSLINPTRIFVITKSINNRMYFRIDISREMIELEINSNKRGWDLSSLVTGVCRNSSLVDSVRFIASFTFSTLVFKNRLS